MRVDVEKVSKGRRGVALPATSLRFESGRAVLAVAETEQRPSVLGLIAAGRMRPDTGTVTIGDLGSTRHPRRSDAWELRSRVALVDAPDVNDPSPAVTVFGVTAEELMFAGLPANPFATVSWLKEHGYDHVSRLPIGDVAPSIRLSLLTELAIERRTADGRSIEGLVLVSPDRHGGDPAEWWSIAEQHAARGIAVLVIAGASSAAVLASVAPRAEVDHPLDPDHLPHDELDDGVLDDDVLPDEAPDDAPAAVNPPDEETDAPEEDAR